MPIPLHDGFFHPDELRARFWQEVARHLYQRDVEPEKASHDMAAYRGQMEAQGATESIYHWEPAEIAESILGGGFSRSPDLPQDSDEDGTGRRSALPTKMRVACSFEIARGIDDRPSQGRRFTAAPAANGTCIATPAVSPVIGTNTRP